MHINNQTNIIMIRLANALKYEPAREIMVLIA